MLQKLCQYVWKWKEWQRKISTNLKAVVHADHGTQDRERYKRNTIAYSLQTSTSWVEETTPNCFTYT